MLLYYPLKREKLLPRSLITKIILRILSMNGTLHQWAVCLSCLLLFDAVPESNDCAKCESQYAHIHKWIQFWVEKTWTGMQRARQNDSQPSSKKMELVLLQCVIVWHGAVAHHWFVCNMNSEFSVCLTIIKMKDNLITWLRCKIRADCGLSAGVTLQT